MFELNYDDTIHLDAEALAEQGIGEGYQRLMPTLRQFVVEPKEICELLDEETGSYSVRCGDIEFSISGPNLDEHGYQSWGRATVALFSIVNEQLANSPHRLYAISGGNDLSGIFLKPDEAVAARASLPNKRDWPYLPQNEPSWFGQHH